MKYYEGPKGVSIKKITEGLFQSERTPESRVLKRLRKCYPCPDLYSYVSGTHGDLGLTFRGLAERGRELEYLEGLQALAP
ncbi:MAG: hypothetical protein RXO24_11720 [Acidilobus sp.]|jgi:hypothetical protein